MAQLPKPFSVGQHPSAQSVNNHQLSSYLSEITIKDEDPVPAPLDADDPPHPCSLAEPDTVLLANITKQRQTWTQPCRSNLPPSDI